MTSSGKLVEEPMNSESRAGLRVRSAIAVLILLATALLASVLLTSCSSSPAILGSSSVEDAGLTTKVTARLQSSPSNTWGVYATTDGNVVLTAPIAKGEMGSNKQEIDDYAKKVLARIFDEIPEVQSVHMMDKNRQDVGTFKRK
jgi:hypothetical protein